MYLINEPFLLISSVTVKNKSPRLKIKVHFYVCKMSGYHRSNESPRCYDRLHRKYNLTYLHLLFVLKFAQSCSAKLPRYNKAKQKKKKKTIERKRIHLIIVSI